LTAPDLAVVVVGAGRSSRFGADKLQQRLAGRTVLEHALAAVRAPLSGAPCALVLRPEDVGNDAERWRAAGVVPVAGGYRRQDSVRNGVESLALHDGAVVVIHDAARPYVPPRDVTAVAEAARQAGAAVLVAAVVDTIKRIGSDGMVEGTVRREHLVRALTPQAFRVGVLRRAWATAGAGDATDEAALVEAAGEPVRAVPGDARNIKVTTRDDLSLVEGLLGGGTRVGQGYDVHRLEAGRPLWLCGVEIPAAVGLAGHSDADVALHAVTDAVLGACGGGDIGEHFPPSEERWRGAASAVFVRWAVELAAGRGLGVVGCDVTLLLEAPRISPYRAAMRARLAELLGVREEAVNVKATTGEGVGFVGRGEGAAALAVVTLAPAPGRGIAATR